MPPWKLVFMGTAALGVPVLQALVQSKDYTVTAVVTQPDRPAGRDLRPHSSPIKLAATELGLPVFQPAKVKAPEFLEQLQELSPDLIVVVAYGQILPQALLDLPPHHCLNVHASILPRYRGAAPIQWAILDQEPETGVTIMQMDAGLDTGPMLSVRRTPIHPSDTAQTLHDRLALLGAELLLDTLPAYLSGELKSQAQPPEGSTYARKITREDGLVDWSLSAAQICTRLRALTPWPGLHTYLQAKDVRLKLLQVEPVDRPGTVPGEITQANSEGIEVSCGVDRLRILRLQKEGGRAVTAREFLAGFPLQPGMRLRAPPRPA